ncbi:MAG: hypothetical protein IPQ19_04920 [Bacteroidetes bacterium]|nr:hypothetical protein [Bacteroidota bacterium]
MIRFPILQKEYEFDLSNGMHKVYFSGGFGIINLYKLDMLLIDTNSNQNIPLKKVFLRSRDIINGERVILCYYFELNNYSKYKLIISNPEVLIIKRGYVFGFSFLKPFNYTISSEYIDLIIMPF